MSAFIVSHDHIDALLTFAILRRVSYWLEEQKTRIEITAENATEIGRILLHENERSVGHRYNETDPANMPGTIGEDDSNYRFRYFDGPPPLSPVAVLKGCNCLAYQSCELDGWKKSVAHSIVKAIEHYAISALPGYDDAPGWEFRRKCDTRAA